MKYVAVALSVILLNLAGCQKSAEPAKTQAPMVKKPSAETSVASSAKQTPSETKHTGAAQDIKYRVRTAKVYRTNTAIEILVPEDIDIEPNRLIEYEKGEDGKYHFVSLIPQ